MKEMGQDLTFSDRNEMRPALDLNCINQHALCISDALKWRKILSVNGQPRVSFQFLMWLH